MAITKLELSSGKGKRIIHGQWKPMYKSTAFNKPFFEVLKIGAKNYQVLFIREDTGQCMMICAFTLKSDAAFYVKHHNKQLSCGTVCNYD